MIYALPAWLLFIIIVGGSIGLVSVSILLMRRTIKPLANGNHNDVAGFFFSAVGVVYAVLLGFVVITVWDNFMTADNATSQEAADIIKVARDSIYFPEPMGSKVREHLRRYTELVINDEWNSPLNDQGKHPGSAQVLAEFNSLWSLYKQLPPSATNANAMKSLDDLSDQRVKRILSSKAVLPGSFWVVLVLGAGIVIYFGLIFYLENTILHNFMLILLTGIIVTNIWLMLIIDNPYRGDLRVSADAFKYALSVIDALPR